MPSRYLFASLLILTACEGASNGTPETEKAASPPIILSAEVVFDPNSDAYELNWTTDPADATVRIEVSSDPDFQVGSGEFIGAFEGETSTLWEAEPGIRRYFIIYAEDGEPMKTAARLLPLEGGRNFRDIGGYETEDGRHVKWGHVFRSGTMSSLTDADYDYLDEIGIKVVCDFRDTQERSEEPTNWRAGDIDYLTFSDPVEDLGSDNPMFQALIDPEATPEDVAEGMAANYAQIAYQEDEGYTAMFDQLAAGETPLAFNCSAGKDRAGTAAALILTALGVPRETVVHDYSLSDDYVDYMAEFLGPEQRAAAEAAPEDHPYAFLFKLPPEKVAPLLASDPKYIEATLSTLETEHGSVMNFIQTELDVTDEELSAMRAALLE